MEKYKYESQITGEIVRNLKEVIKVIFEDYKYYKIFNLHWKYNRNGF